MDTTSVVVVPQQLDQTLVLMKQFLLALVVEVEDDIIVEDRVVFRALEVAAVAVTEIMVDLELVVLVLF